MILFSDIAQKFAELTKEERVLLLNMLIHVLPTKGVDFQKNEEDSIEHCISMLQNVLSIQQYSGPPEEVLLKRIELIDIEAFKANTVAEEVEGPGATYVNPDVEIGEEVEPPKKVQPTVPATAAEKALNNYPDGDWY